MSFPSAAKVVAFLASVTLAGYAGFAGHAAFASHPAPVPVAETPALPPPVAPTSVESTPDPTPSETPTPKPHKKTALHKVQPCPVPAE